MGNNVKKEIERKKYKRKKEKLRSIPGREESTTVTFSMMEAPSPCLSLVGTIGLRDVAASGTKRTK
jgi:hypothetical protein